MILNMNGRDVEIMGYDDYLRDYEFIVKDEFKTHAEQDLINALENFDISDMTNDGSVCVDVEDEYVKNNRQAQFIFLLGIGYITYYFVSCSNPETGHCIGYKLTTLWEDGSIICWSARDMYEHLEFIKETRGMSSDFLTWSDKAEVGEVFQRGRTLIEVIEGE